MRDIKFRAWDNDGKPKRGKHYHYFKLSDNLADVWGKSNCIEQFTGLKDKNKKEYYQSDIAKQTFSIDDYFDGEHYTNSGYYIGEVVIVPSRGVCLKNPIRISDDGTGKCNWFIPLRSYRSELIGNIHENPELLEAKDD